MRLFSGVVSYLVFGFVYLKFIKKKTGYFAFPNYDFWLSIGKNIKVIFFENTNLRKYLFKNFKAGISYSFSKIKSNSNTYEKI